MNLSNETVGRTVKTLALRFLALAVVIVGLTVGENMAYKTLELAPPWWNRLAGWTLFWLSIEGYRQIQNYRERKFKP